MSVAGAERLAATLRAAADDLADLSGITDQAGALVLGAAVIPRRTGRLASTAHVEADALGFTVAAGGQAAPYVGYVHARDPFLSKAYDRAADDVIDLVTRHLTDALAGVKGA